MDPFRYLKAMPRSAESDLDHLAGQVATFGEIAESKIERIVAHATKAETQLADQRRALLHAKRLTQRLLRAVDDVLALDSGS